MSMSQEKNEHNKSMCSIKKSSKKKAQEIIRVQQSANERLEDVDKEFNSIMCKKKMLSVFRS